MPSARPALRDTLHLSAAETVLAPPSRRSYTVQVTCLGEEISALIAPSSTETAPYRSTTLCGVSSGLSKLLPPWLGGAGVVMLSHGISSLNDTIGVYGIVRQDLLRTWV
jgi:hypothetical protein